MNYQTLKTDILILGSGGAGLFAALHACQANPDLDVTIAVKGLLGKCGCTRMVQGGYNVALSPGDSVERHFMDTINGGKWLPDQDMAMRLCQTAVTRVQELENELGCFFDRNDDGSLHHKAFAGQTFDRTVHKGDLTGIEIISRLMEQVRALAVNMMEEHRALALLPSRDGDALAGVLMVDMRSGEFRVVRAKTVLMATGGGPTMYRYHTPSGDKSMDGLAMALRLGVGLRDMEMVQFHPTGLLAGRDTRMTGTVLEEGLRGAGGYLLDGNGERFMLNYDADGERATRDIVSRAIYAEMRAGRTTPNGGVYIAMSHLGPARVAQKFGLFVAGEDAGGAHGANRLGGNGVANSTVFGGIAGDEMAGFAAGQSAWVEFDKDLVDAAIDESMSPLRRAKADINSIRDRLLDLMWDGVGVLRDARGITRAQAQLVDLKSELLASGIGDANRVFALSWHDWLNLRSLIEVSEVIAAAALSRENSRGAHYREDFPQVGSLEESYFTIARRDRTELVVERRPVEFSIVKPGESLIQDD